MMDHIDHFRQAIEASGLEAPAEIHEDGQLHRFSTNGKRNDDSGWYVLHGDGVPAGAFGCWRTGFQSNWSAKADHDLSDIERHAMRDRMKAVQLQREAEQTRVHAQAKDAAAALLATSEATTAHPYLTAKGISPHGVRRRGTVGDPHARRRGHVVQPANHRAGWRQAVFVWREGKRLLLQYRQA
jgi:putative DNA primase/helicase